MSAVADLFDLGVDLGAVVAWMDRQGLGEGQLSGVNLLAGGTQNVLVRFDRAGETYVLRRPPAHKRSNSDDTMRREITVLQALSGSQVPHPAFVAGCDDVGIIGAVFYLMSAVNGFCPANEAPTWLGDDLGAQHELGLAMVDGLVSLAAVDHEAVGLGGFGRVDGWLDRQVQRWRNQYESYSSAGAYTPQLGGLDRVGRWLDDHQPATAKMGLIHGDFHFGNVLVDPNAPRISAIVDWELATLGAKLLDLGHLLASWEASLRDVKLPGLPSSAELVERYAAGGGDITDVAWFHVLACYRLAVILEGTYARALDGKAAVDVGDHLHAVALGLIGQAEAAMSSASSRARGAGCA